MTKDAEMLSLFPFHLIYSQNSPPFCFNRQLYKINVMQTKYSCESLIGPTFLVSLSSPFFLSFIFFTLKNEPS